MTADPKVVSGDRPAQRSSLLIRRVHFYLGLFLAPWLVMYAVSTIMMNHRPLVASFYSPGAPKYQTERELDYSRAFPADTEPAAMGKLILTDLGLEGAHRVSGGRNGKPLVIDRQHPLANRRITFDSESGRLQIAKEEFRAFTFLERLHRRRGYQHPFALEDAWAFTVDLAIVAMVFWVASGLWLWWELRSTRLWGAWCTGLGLALFAVLLALL